MSTKGITSKITNEAWTIGGDNNRKRWSKLKREKRWKDVQPKEIAEDPPSCAIRKYNDAACLDMFHKRGKMAQYVIFKIINGIAHL